MRLSSLEDLATDVVTDMAAGKSVFVQFPRFCNRQFWQEQLMFACKRTLRLAGEDEHIEYVAINDDDSVRRLKGDPRPVNELEDRMAVLAGLASVDWVVPFSEDTPERVIGAVLPDVLVKGGDYRPDEIAGARSVLQNGGEVRVLAFRDGQSSSRIIDKLLG